MKALRIHTILKTRLRPSRSLLLGILWILGLSSTCFGQIGEPWKGILKDRLDSDQQVEYLHLVGYMGQFLFTEMKFAHDRENWTGMVEYPDQGIRYDLEGGIVDDYIFLQEFNSEEEQVGLWKINRNLEKYECTWHNTDGTMDMELVMYDDLWNPDFKKQFGQERTVFRGEYEKSELEITISKKIDGSAEIEIFDRDLKKNYPASLSCVNRSCRQMDISFEDQHGRNKSYRANLEFDYFEMSKMSERIEVPSYNFKRIQTNQTRVKTTLKPSYYLVVEYPDLIGPSATRINKYVDDIFRKLEIQLELLTEGEEEVGKRLSTFATVWFDVYYWSDELISGKWIVQKSWNNEVESLPLNYDLTENRAINIPEQFKSGFDIQYYLEHFVESQRKTLPAYRDLLIRNKLQKADFSLINFGLEGLILSTEFDTLFGPFELVVPYAEIGQYLKKKSELRKLIL